MKRILILIILITVPVLASAQLQEMRVTWDYPGSSFEEFVSEAESHHQVMFYFKDEWTKGLLMPDLGTGPLMVDLLTRLFADKAIFFVIDEGGNIILTRDFAVRTFASSAMPSDNWMPRSDRTDDKERTAVSEYLVYEIGNPAEKGRQGNISLTGYVRDKISGEPLRGVTVFVSDLAKGTATDASGFYLVNLPRGSYNIRFSHLGMKEAGVNTRVYGSGSLDIEMVEEYISIDGAVVTARKSDALRRMETGLEKVNMATFRLMPSSLGETDILKNILLLPGVKTVGEASQGFNVRGGASDQNLILLYGIPLFNPSHFFGFFTSVNSDIIRDLHLYKGGIPARYGGRLSSVIDILPRDGSNKEFSGNAGISPVATHLLLDIPVVKEKLSALVAVRSTYSNFVMDIVDYPLLNNSRASFYDLNSRLVWSPDEKNSVELSGYLSNDAFRLNSDTTYSYTNRVLSMKWNRSLPGDAVMSVMAANSDYRYGVSSLTDAAKAFNLSYKINFTSVRSELSLPAGKIHDLNTGIEFGRYAVMPGDRQPASASSLIRPMTIRSETALENALWLEDRMKLSEQASLSIGLRYSLFSAFGPRTVMLYIPGLPRSSSAIIDSLSFPAGKPFKNFSGPEFRVSFNYMISNSSSVKLNYNHTRQYLHLLTNSVSISPTDTWKLSDYYLRPQVADQYSAGYYLTIPWNNLELSAEIYFKPIRNMTEFKGGTVLTMNETIEKDIINVDGRAYGAELMFRKSVGKITWHLSYTYSRILLRSISEFESEAINAGNWFPASHDKPHDLSMSINYTVTRRLNFSLGYVYNTGRPITYPVGVYQSGTTWLIHYSDRNKYRVPDYLRLDFSARLNGNLKSKKLMNPIWTFSCYNLLGRANVYSEYFMMSGHNVSAYRLSVFARPIPTLTYSFDF
ncbi:MAG: TonB-dependent receptor [Bacteroidales bacterium]